MGFPSRRWRLWRFAALLLVGVVALGCALARGPGSGVTEANFEKLQEGMTPEQVNEILGAENIQEGAGSCGWLTISYQDQLASVEITVEFSVDTRNSDPDHTRLTEKRMDRIPLTLGDFLRCQLAKVRRRLGL